MGTSVRGLAAAVTLAGWADKSSLLDIADLYDLFRGSLGEAYADYRAARCRGRDGQADADTALEDICEVSALLDVLSEEIAWRKSWYLLTNRLWPLSKLLNYGT